MAVNVYSTVAEHHQELLVDLNMPSKLIRQKTWYLSLVKISMDLKKHFHKLW